MIYILYRHTHNPQHRDDHRKENKTLCLFNLFTISFSLYLYLPPATLSLSVYTKYCPLLHHHLQQQQPTDHRRKSSSMYEVFNWGYSNDEPPKRFSLSIAGSEINIDGPNPHKNNAHNKQTTSTPPTTTTTAHRQTTTATSSHNNNNNSYRKGEGSSLFCIFNFSIVPVSDFVLLYLINSYCLLTLIRL